ncbi:MAG TPA: GspE/PulE family protein [Patescibacteria group bacterium]|nr:GspE/PulE family protein [Patescibacteria group bacterium]
MDSIEQFYKQKSKHEERPMEEKLQGRMNEIHLKELEAVTEKNARSQGYSYIDLKSFPLPQEALLTLSKDEMTLVRTVCIFRTNKQIKLAAVDPDADDFQKILHRVKEDNPFQTIDLFMISAHSLEIALKAYDRIPKIKEVNRGVAISEEEINRFQQEITSLQELNQKIQAISVTDIFTLILAAAVKAQASDLHFETEEHEVVVRMRVDGVLHEIARVPKKLWSKVASRIKFLAHLKINVDMIPQDGKFVIGVGKTKIDVRVSTLPATFGESIVFRLLFSTGEQMTFEKLGLEGYAYDVLLEEMEKSSGMIISSGPTGSGKTTTLHAMMMRLKSAEINIMTIEDPIEYELEGITQTQVDTKHNMTFAAGLRAILRQDPDIILVGETRDSETAETTVQAALSGHLVLSTIHANSAAATIPRLLSMKVPAFLLAPALNVILGQRLVRRVCQTCKGEATLDGRMIERITKELTPIKRLLPPNVNLEKLVFWKGKGCEACHGLGYKGRVGIYEVLKKDSEIEKIILSGSLSEYAIQELAVKQGMITMIQDGLLKALRGVTSPEEVFSAAG